jgi:proteasome accessory factor C
VSDTLRRLRRVLLLIPPACRAAANGRGVPLERARRLTGALSEAQVVEDVRSVRELYDLAEPGEQMLTLEVEDGEVRVLYAPHLETPLALSLPEGAMLLGALRPHAESGGPAVRKAVAKLRRVIPEALREAADQLVRGVDVATPAPSPWAPGLRDAIDRRLEVTLDYRAVADGTLARRKVEPRLLLHRDGMWYLAAWSVARQEEHLYRLDRVAAMEVGPRVFDRHRGPSPERYARRRRLYIESGAERDVTLRLSGQPARLARQRGGGRVTPEADGGATVVKRMSTGNHLAAVVLGHGGDMTVLGPPDVRADLRDRVERLRARYR